MHSGAELGVDLLVLGAAALVVVSAGRLSTFLRIPGSFFLLAAGAMVVSRIGPFRQADPHVVERIVTVALAFVLFDGGLRIGWRRLRPVIRPVVGLGIGATGLCVAGAAAVTFLTTEVTWYQATLVGAAVAPTDPAVVFALLGNRDPAVDDPGATILEGESGSNDPIGIALLASLVAAGGLSGDAIGATAREFFLQLVVGSAIGLAAAGGAVLVARRAGHVASRPRGSIALASIFYPAGVLGLFFVTSAAHGSGFLAVFAAGIVLGDQPSSPRRTVPLFGRLAVVGEAAAFVALGLTIDLGVVARVDVWLPGLVLGLALTVLIRPVLGAGFLVRAKLTARERVFVLVCGLKGAVPILLGLTLVARRVPDGPRLYGIVVVVVLLSVVVLGTAVPTIARALESPSGKAPPKGVEPGPAPSDA